MKRGAVLLIVGLLVGACARADNATAVGSVIAVDGDLVSVHSFTVLSGGETLEFIPALGENFSIPLVHLRDHLRSGETIRVTYHEVEGVLVATDVVDALGSH